MSDKLSSATSVSKIYIRLCTEKEIWNLLRFGKDNRTDALPYQLYLKAAVNVCPLASADLQPIDVTREYSLMYPRGCSEGTL